MFISYIKTKNINASDKIKTMIWRTYTFLKTLTSCLLKIKMNIVIEYKCIFIGM